MRRRDFVVGAAGLLVPRVAHAAWPSSGLPYPSGNSPQVQQFFNRLMTLPTTARQALYAALINGLVSDGVWSLLDALYVFAAADSDTSLTNLVQANYKGTLVVVSGNGPQFTVDRGWANGNSNGDAVSSNFNPSTASGANYIQNSAMFGVWVTGSTQESVSSVANAAADSHCEIVPLWSDTHTYWAVNGNGTEVNPILGLGTPAGWWTAQRTASSAQALYLNGSSINGNSNTSSALTNSNLNYKTNQNSVTNKNAAAVIGASLTAGQQTSLYTRLQTFLHAVGAI